MNKTKKILGLLLLAHCSRHSRPKRTNKFERNTNKSTQHLIQKKTLSKRLFTTRQVVRCAQKHCAQKPIVLALACQTCFEKVCLGDSISSCPMGVGKDLLQSINVVSVRSHPSLCCFHSCSPTSPWFLSLLSRPSPAVSGVPTLALQYPAACSILAEKRQSAQRAV